MVFSLALATFVDKTCLLIHSYCTLVISKHPQKDAMQVQSEETMLQDQSHHFCTITLIPISSITDENPELPIAAAPIDSEESRISDQLPVFSQFGINT